MNGKEFLKIINDLDDELIDGADRFTKSKNYLKLIISAACLIAATVMVTIGLLLIKEHKDGIKTAENNNTLVVSITTSSATSESNVYTSESTNNNNVETKIEATSSESIQETEIITEPESIIEESFSETTLMFEDNNEDEAWTEEVSESYYEETDDVPVIAEYRIISIDQASIEVLDTNNDSWELFWWDDYNNYYMHPGEAEMTFVLYENGEIEPLLEALDTGHIIITDLDNYGISYFKE